MTVRLATPAETPAAARVLAAAFREDPVQRWLIPEERRRRPRLERFFGLELALSTCQVWTTPDFAGASIALPGEAWRVPFRRQLAHGVGYARVFGHRLPLALALQTAMELRHMRGPHWYVLFVGVAPEGQGRGLGTALMQPTLDAGLPVYLEASSERSRALYERLGFRVEGEEIRVAGSPPLWPMVRG